MRQRKWTFYKVILYLGLLATTVGFGYFIYSDLFRCRECWKNIWEQVLGLGILIQATFYVLCVRLVHYYLSKKLLPGRGFNGFLLAGLIFNSCIAICSLLLLAYGFFHLILKANRQASAEVYTFLLIESSYTFITIYLSATTIILRRYNRYQVATDEEKWLNQLGSTSTTS